MENPPGNQRVTLYLTFGWYCPNCNHENAVSRQQLGADQTDDGNARASIPLVPEQVECEHCRCQWTTL